MLKILQARLQQYENWELSDVQTGFRKGRETRDQIANIHWITEKAREFQKNIYFCFIDYIKAFDCVDHNKLWKILKEMGIPDHLSHLLRKLDSILKRRDITLPTKVHLVKAMVFPVFMYGCESWTVKKAECQIDAFELCCWRLLRVPWTARGSNHSILKEISPEYSLEGLMVKLKLQYFGHIMRRTDSLEKTLMLGKIEGRRRRGWQRMRWLDGITGLM